MIIVKEIVKEGTPQPRLNVEQIKTLSEYCLKNASELVSEAQLLFENKKYARSFFLSVLALEETSKRDVLFEAVFLGEDDKEWKSFWNRFRRHDVKLASMLKDYITIRSNRKEHTPFEIVREYLTKVKMAGEDAKEVNLIKMWAIYADIFEGKPFGPSQVISKKLASTLLKKAQQHLDFHHSFKPTAQELEINLSIKSEMKEGESFIDYWYRTHGYKSQAK